jgi:AcrR family transcriptional regulator
MKKSSNIKENIIEVTTELIRQSGGDINDITIRMIAEKANVGTGLINYHFQSKENLITLCVQRIIENVVMEFSPLDRHYQNDRERLTDWAIQVFDFLFENKAISRISILGDLSGYSIDSNSVKTQRGFMLAMRNVNDVDKNMLSFVLTSVMQTAFLSANVGVELLGYDFSDRSSRNVFITRLVSVIFDGIRK